MLLPPHLCDSSLTRHGWLVGGWGVTGLFLVKRRGDEGQQQPLAWWHPSHSVRLPYTRGMMVLLPPHLCDSSLTRQGWLVGGWGVTGLFLVKRRGDEGQQQPLAWWHPSHSVRVPYTRGMMVLLPPNLCDSSLTRQGWLAGGWGVTWHCLVKRICDEGQQQPLDM